MPLGRLSSLLPRSLGWRVFTLYGLTLALMVGVGGFAFLRYQFTRQIDDAEISAGMLSEVLVQTISDSVVIGDYDAITRVLQKSLVRSQFSSAAFIDMKGGKMVIDAPAGKYGLAPRWLHARIDAELGDQNRAISVGGRDYGVLRLHFDTEAIAANLWQLVRAAAALVAVSLLAGLMLIGVPLSRWLGNLQRIDSIEEQIRSGSIDPRQVLADDAPIEIRRTVEVLSRTAATLQAHRERAQVTLNAIADSVLTTDVHGVVVYANPAAGRLQGAAPETLFGRSLTSLLPGVSDADIAAAGWIGRRIVLAETSDDTPSKILDTTLSPILGEDRVVVGYVLACRDVTEAHRLERRLRLELMSREEALGAMRSLLVGLRENAEPGSSPTREGDSDDLAEVSGMVLGLVRDRETSRRALEEAKSAAEASSRAKGEFLANMSHEIRTPLNGIIGMADLVLGSSLSGEQREHMSLVKASADSLLTIVNDILDFSKIEAGRLELETIAFDLRDAMSSVVAAQAQRAQAKGLTLSVDIGPDLPQVVCGDPVRIGQVLLNLVGNAVKFTEQGGVFVSVVRDPAGDAPADAPGERAQMRLIFTVRDTGVGIPDDKLISIFDAFSQADTSITRRFGGTGLGLTISRQLATNMGGDLHVASEAGVGSTFSFDVVLGVGRPEELGHRGAAATQVPALRPLDVLLVEDNPVNQRLAQTLLQRAGHAVTIADNGELALAHIERHRFDVVLMDMQMPVLDGLATTRRIRADEAGGEGHLPIVAMTANAMVGDRERCLDAGMDDYVAKPVRRDELFRALARVLPTHVGGAQDAVPPADAVRDTLAASPGTSSTREAPMADYAADLSAADAEFVEIIGESFLAQFPDSSAELHTAWHDRDMVRLARGAHTLKGLFLTFGARRPGALALELESAARQGEVEGCRPIIASLEAEGARFCEALRVHLDAASASTVSESSAARSMA